MEKLPEPISPRHEFHDFIDDISDEQREKKTSPITQVVLTKLEDLFSTIDISNPNSEDVANKMWKSTDITEAKIQQSRRVVNLVTFIITLLDTEKHQNQIANLKFLARDAKFLSALSLIKAKANLSSIRKFLMSQLLTLSEYHIGQIQEFCKNIEVPIGCERLGEMLHLYKKIDNANALYENHSRLARLDEIFKSLTMNGDVGMALELSHYVKLDFLRIEVFKKIIKSPSFTLGHADEATRVAFSMSDDDFLSRALNELVESLVSDHKSDKLIIDKCLHLTALIPNVFLKSNSYYHIVKTLAENGETDEALKITAKISNVDRRSAAFCNVIKAMVKKGQVQEAMKLFDNLTNSDKTYASEYIACGLAASGATKEAITLAKELTLGRAGTLREIVKVVVDKGDIDAALEIAVMILDGEESDIANRYSDAISSIFAFLAKSGDVLKAVGRLQQTPYLKLLLPFTPIMKAFVQRGYFVEGIEFSKSRLYPTDSLFALAEEIFKSEAELETKDPLLFKIIRELMVFKEDTAVQKVQKMITDPTWKKEVTKLIQNQK